MIRENKILIRDPLFFLSMNRVSDPAVQPSLQAVQVNKDLIEIVIKVSNLYFATAAPSAARLIKRGALEAVL